MTPTEVLIGARKLVEKPKQWNRQWLALDKARESCSPYGDDACSFCMLGALDRAAASAEGHSVSADAFLREVVGLHPDALESIGEWNDAPERTHAEVLEAFDKAIELSRG